MAFNNSSSTISLHSIPLPEISLDVGVLMASTFSLWFSYIFIFAICYIISHYILFRKLDVNLRHEVSSSMMSLAHGAGCLLTSIMILAKPGTFASPNTNIENFLLQYSMAYFLVDLIHSLVFFNDQYVFLLHHLATLYVFFTCSFVVEHGAYGLIILLGLAESTCICHNVWHTTGLVKDDVLWAKKTFDFMSPPYFGLYLFVRGVFGTAFLFKMVEFYFSGKADGYIPMWARVSWLLVIAVGMVISVYWATRKWKGWLHMRSDNDRKNFSRFISMSLIVFLTELYFLFSMKFYTSEF